MSWQMGRFCSAATTDGVEGVKNFILDTVRQAGSNPCPPIVLGVGIGGSFDKCVCEYITDKIGNRSDLELRRVFITHSGVSEETVQKAVETVQKLQPFEEICVTRAGCTVSSHCGPGTIGVLYGNTLIQTDNTTPENYEVQKFMRQMVDAGCEYCVMEVSSQALAQGRCIGLEFSAAVFTNLTQDHLDYHGTMENYANAKAKLFSQCKCAVLNKDDSRFDFMKNAVLSGDIIGYSKKDNRADYFADNIHLGKAECEYILYTKGKTYNVRIDIPGEFTVYNSLAAISCCSALGIDTVKCVKALAETGGVPGRAEVLKTDTPYTIIIDYAHSPDAIENILSSVRQFAKGRVIALFGCGGDRDKTKRPLMAQKAAENADYLIITSDNPRTENPDEIIEDIIPGINGKGTSCAIISDRTQAIDYAIKNAREGDVIVLCGKGHETYQIIGDEKIHYDEREIVKRILDKHK